MPTKTMPSVRMLYKGVEVDERTEEYILKRIQKAEKVLKNILEYEVQVEMDKKGKFSVAFMIKTPYELYRTKERSESIEGSVDMAVEEMLRQSAREQEKLRSIRERGARSIKKKVVVDDNARFRK